MIFQSQFRAILFFFFQAEDGIRDADVTGVQTCALPIFLAESNFSASERAIEGERGFAHVLGEKPNLSAITSGLGESWELSRNAYKPYPCGVVVHPVIDACLELRRHYSPEATWRVTIKVNPLAVERADRKAPRDGREAKLSLQHGAAVALIHGRAGVAQFADPATPN